MRDIKDLLIENGLSGVFYEEGDAIFFLEDGSFKAGLVVLVDDKLSQIVCDDGRVFEKKAKEIPVSFVEKNFEVLLDKEYLKLNEFMNEAENSENGTFIDTEKLFGKKFSLKDHMTLCNMMIARAGFSRAKATDNGVVVYMD